LDVDGDCTRPRGQRGGVRRVMRHRRGDAGQRRRLDDDEHEHEHDYV
jgi:hypothetical protein